MANINETISEVAKLNPELARQIQKYVKDHSYGLVFERNLPEAIRLYKKEPIAGDIVNILPVRGEEEKDENKVSWVVKSIKDGVASLEHDGETKDVPVEDIVVLISYRDVIYPGLKEIDRVEQGNPDDPYHMVINSENYHALEALTYAYAGKVDCIYIDPPYNSGAKDWKYNNDYVVVDDQYRHSKWLAFMERRLKLAKQLLNPKDSVLLVTIDEREYARLSLLLEQNFPEATIQMVSITINPSGAVRKNLFARSDEYMFIVLIGDAHVNQVKGFGDETEVRWWYLRRLEYASRRGTVKGGVAQFYPIYVDDATLNIVKIGEPITSDVDRYSVPQIDGTTAVFPVKDDGMEMNWGVTGETLQRLIDEQVVQVVKNTRSQNQPYTIKYLSENYKEKIDEGRWAVRGYREDGSKIVVETGGKLTRTTTVWSSKQYDAKTYGTTILKSIVKDDRFSFPKSLYSVYDALKNFVSEKPDALIIDFFAGSGTTLHAVSLLNAVDDGRRRCICVTNNEVSADEQKKFIKDGLRPYDMDWEKYGIANYVTWVRTKCSINGVDVDGNPLDGDYGKPSKGLDLGFKLKKSDGFKANAVFCELTYESAWPIRLDRAFDAIAPILWMQAGCQGPIIKRIGKSYLTTDFYGVLFDYGQASKFCEKVKKTQSITTVFVVTDDQRRYSNMCKRLPGVEVHRLYETFLRTFEICGEGGLD
ncbi:site-specific DNA-methyltransferase [Vallitalea pronyensis]|uniref:Site-specific DNA-methyltransferase n=1 Tax=Vallitalea pronyensis TaxID=1348613 RepID=A0A8J8MH96_9FIRM|nr:DNA methyltransferase [Vallitalea pronyensis]QUI21564.1 site-specific DNA-methyltransferase [Vallitalea pronyensis]